jgi:hypothetical protein
VLCSYCKKYRSLGEIEFDEFGENICVFCIEGKRAVESNFNSVVEGMSSKSFIDDKQNTLKRWF